MNAPVALIIGAGHGISGEFAKGLAARGYQVALASRKPDKLNNLASSEHLHAFTVDVSVTDSIVKLFSAVDEQLGSPEVVLFNTGARLTGAITELDRDAVALALHTNAMGAFVAAQEAARRMLPRGRGAIFFTGATASIKGFARSAPFAMSKFAVRGLAQSLARELAPQGIHVAHFVIDGAVQNSSAPDEFSASNIAGNYLAVLDQPPGAWSWEIELRSYRESF